MRRLPPLAAVRVFESAARLENFTAAAVELGMTQAAVSYQIRSLEARLGLPLFRREKRRVALTEAGRRAAAASSRALDAIETAFSQLMAEDERTLTISAPQTFANAWLAWRLGGFQMGHPDMAVRLLVDDALVDFATASPDVAVRAGHGPWEGLHADPLIRNEFTPMCSAGFLRRRGLLRPADLSALPLISPDNPFWSIWLKEAGVPVPSFARPGVSMTSQSNDANAAMAGQGVAMLTPFFWRQDLADRRLVAPFEQVSTDGRAYWLVAPDYRRNVPKIKRFRDWLTAEVTRRLPSDGIGLAGPF